MISFDGDFFEDNRANEIVKAHINKRLMLLMNEVFDDYAKGGYEEISENDKGFADILMYYFPQNYPLEKMTKLFFELYALLKSEEEFVPVLVQEYVLAQLILQKTEVLKEMGLSTRESIAEREYIIKVLMRERKQEIEEEGITIGELLLPYEDLEEYLETCFWDADFELLNYWTEEELKKKGMDKILGIDFEETSNTFVVPKEWLD